MALTRISEKFLPAVRKRRKHFARKRAYAEQFEAAGLPDVAQKLRDCQETEVLACCSHCGQSWWILNKCRLRVCPLCAYEVALLRGQFMLALTRNMQWPKLLTLTMPLWRYDPKEGISLLRESFAKLRKTKVFRPVVGGAYTIEVKVQDEGLHIHMHVLLDAPFLPYQRLFSAWKKILACEAPQVDIRAAPTEQARIYVAKYASKSASFDSAPDIIVRWYEATKGQRLFATFGKWYNAKIEELDKEVQPQTEKAHCPFCKTERTIFLARDGPYIYGHEEWQTVAGNFLRDGEWSRPIDGVDAEITDPIRPDEIAERAAAKQQKESINA